MHAATAPRARPRILPRIDNVLYATDFSKCSQLAMPFACAIAQQHNSTLHIVHVLGPSPLVGPLGAPYTETDVEEKEICDQLQKLTNAAPVKTIRHEYSVHRGAVPEVVCRIAEKWNIDLIIVGTHGRHGVRQLVLGSVAEQIFRRSACPVLTVGPGVTADSPRRGKFATILLGSDLSNESLEVLDYAHALALADNAKLILLHVVEESPELAIADPNYMDDAIAVGMKHLKEFAPPDVRDTEAVIKIGAPAECIVRAATEREADLIVIGTRHGTTLSAHNPWSVAHEVVCGAPCPVLTVRH